MQVVQVAVCGSDYHAWRTGSYRPDFVPGHEVSGTVLDPGPRTDLKVGDRVTAITTVPCYECDFCKEGRDNICEGNQASPGSYTDGCMMEQFAVRADLARKLPDEVNDFEGAMVEPVSVALHATRLAKVKAGDIVLITGCGFYGAFVAEFCKYFGAGKIVMTDINQVMLDKLYGMHPEYILLNGKAVDFKKKLKEEAPNGYDVYIDCEGLVSLINDTLPLLRKGHVCAFVGNVNVYNTTVLNLINVILNEYKLVGCYAYNTAEFDEVIQIMKEKKIDFRPYAGAVFSLKDVQKAFELLHDKSNAEFKVFVSPLA